MLNVNFVQSPKFSKLSNFQILRFIFAEFSCICYVKFVMLLGNNLIAFFSLKVEAATGK